MLPYIDNLLDEENVFNKLSVAILDARKKLPSEYPLQFQKLR